MYELVFENKDFLIVDKSPDINFHSSSDQNGLFHTVKTEMNLQNLFPVHRLDKMTSGLIIFAKRKPAATEFGLIFEKRRIEKYYLAISDKKPKKQQGLIKGDMIPLRSGSWKLINAIHNPAVTQFFNCGLNRGLRLFILKPRTGRTHQLRVALKTIGSPVFGDTRYSPLTCNEADRAYLHSFVLKFEFKNEKYCFRKLPRIGREFTSSIFKTIVTDYVKPWDLKWPVV
jgi:tRNA pseudouridine32 synthase/23S rRNA pseudouridine746 synthase